MSKWILIFCLVGSAARAAAPSAFIICALKGDRYDKLCDNTERRLREAGYQVHRIDGPEFRDRQPFEQALRQAEKPLVYISGHGSVLPTGGHRLSLGKDGGKKYYPTEVMIQQARALNRGAQFLVESCQSGQLRGRVDSDVCLGTTCRADEYSPANRVLSNKELVDVKSGVLSPVLDLLNLPANEFKYWSGGKCEIGGEALREFISARLSGAKTVLECEVLGESKTIRRPAADIRREEAACEKRIEEFKRRTGLRVEMTNAYEFEVRCRDFKPEEALRVAGTFSSREQLVQALNTPPAAQSGNPPPVPGGDLEAYETKRLFGKGCEPVPGFVTKKYAAQVYYRARRDGQPTLVYDRDLDPDVRREVMPFIQDWQQKPPAPPPTTSRGAALLPGPDETDDSAPLPRSAVPASIGTATPDFGKLVFRHARCEEGPYVPRQRIGAGLSFREHAGDVP